MSDSAIDSVEFECPKCGIWFASPITFKPSSLKILHGLKMRCPCCFENFIFLEENVRFNSKKELSDNVEMLLRPVKK